MSLFTHTRVDLLCFDYSYVESIDSARQINHYVTNQTADEFMNRWDDLHSVEHVLHAGEYECGCVRNIARVPFLPRNAMWLDEFFYSWSGDWYSVTHVRYWYCSLCGVDGEHSKRYHHVPDGLPF